MDPRDRIFRQVNGGGMSSSSEGTGVGDETDANTLLNKPKPVGEEAFAVGDNWYIRRFDGKGGVTYMDASGNYVPDFKKAAVVGSKATAPNVHLVPSGNGGSVLVALDAKGNPIPTKNAGGTTSIGITIGGKSPKQIQADLDHTTAQTGLANAQAKAAPINASANQTSANAAAQNATTAAGRAPAQNALDNAQAGNQTVQTADKAVDLHAKLVGAATNQFEQAYRGIMTNAQLSDAEKQQAIADAKQLLLSGIRDGLDANQRATQANTAFNNAATQANNRNTTLSSFVNSQLSDMTKGGSRDGNAMAGFAAALGRMANAEGNGAAPVAQTPFLTSLQNGGQMPNQQATQMAVAPAAVATPGGPQASAADQAWSGASAVAPGAMAPAGGRMDALMAAAQMALQRKGMSPQQAQKAVQDHFGAPTDRGMQEPGTMDSPTPFGGLASPYQFAMQGAL